MMLLNTDWMTQGNAKMVKIHTPSAIFETKIVERKPKILTILPTATLEPTHNLHIEIIDVADDFAWIRVHGSTPARIIVRGRTSYTETFDFNKSSVQEWKLMFK